MTEYGGTYFFIGDCDDNIVGICRRCLAFALPPFWHSETESTQLRPAEVCIHLLNVSW